MTRVLVADPEPLLVSVVLRGLDQLGLDVSGCMSQAVLERQLRNHAFDLLIVDCSFLGLREQYLGLARVIVTFSFLGEPTEQELFRNYRLLRKPFTSVELAGVLQDELGRLMLRPTSLLEALGRAHRKRDTCSIETCSEALASICVVEGEVVHAVWGTLEGEPALFEILSRPSSIVECALLKTERQSIQRPFRELILGLLGEIDRFERDGRRLSGPPFRDSSFVRRS